MHTCISVHCSVADSWNRVMSGQNEIHTVNNTNLWLTEPLLLSFLSLCSVLTTLHLQTASHTFTEHVELWCEEKDEISLEWFHWVLLHHSALSLLHSSVTFGGSCLSCDPQSLLWSLSFGLFSASHWALNINLFRLHLLIWPSPFQLISDLTSGQPLTCCHARRSWHTLRLSLAQIRSCQPLFLQETADN